MTDNRRLLQGCSLARLRVAGPGQRRIKVPGQRRGLGEADSSMGSRNSDALGDPSDPKQCGALSRRWTEARLVLPRHALTHATLFTEDRSGEHRLALCKRWVKT